MKAVSPRTGMKRRRAGEQGAGEIHRAWGPANGPSIQGSDLFSRIARGSVPTLPESNNERLWIPTEAAHLLIVRSLGSSSLSFFQLYWGIVDKNCINLRCTTWSFDICEMVNCWLLAYNGMFFSLKKEDNLVICNNRMNPSYLLSEMNQTERQADYSP